MNLTEIESEWAHDSEIDDTDLSNEALRIPKLHHKYHQILTRERMRLTQYESQRKELDHILTMYYKNRLTREEMKQYDLEPLDKTYVNQEVPSVVEVHPDMVSLKEKIGITNEKIDLVKSILSQIHQRSFQIRDALEAKKFYNGV